MINFVIQNDWKWNHCRLPIKRADKHCKRKEEEYFYQVISSDDTGPMNQEKIKIVLDRPFPFEPETGFVWHKSWNLPQISVSINEEDVCILREQYKQIRCEIMSVYPIKHSNSYYLHEISLEGSCLKSIHQNPTVFKFLKFGETSFNHNRNKFCLLIWVYGQNAYKDKDDLFCLISSPIYVDSRKQARKKQTQCSSSTVVHSPSKFIATIRGIKGSISNSSEGFISYYGAQNIRNKIKHPFYISYHFDKIFRMYINTESKLTLAESLNKIEAARYSEGQQTGPNGNNEENVLLLQITEQSQKYRKKILSIIQKWKYGLLQFAYTGIPVNLEKWVPISKQQIKSSYKIHYENQILKEEECLSKKQQGNQNSPVNDREIKNIECKNIENSEQKSVEPEKLRTFQLRTIIDLSRPRKRVKTQQQQ